MQGGFSLVEAMAAAGVLAAGVVGAAALHGEALRTRQDAVLMDRALALAADLAERIVANRAATSGGDPDNPYLGLSFDAGAGGTPRSAAGCFESASCDAAQTAAADIHDVTTALAQDFPGGRIVVCRDANSWSAGELVWPCSGAAGAPVIVKVGWRAHEGAGPRVAVALPEGAS